MMKLYIAGPPDDGDGVYLLVNEGGQVLASHICSVRAYAAGDLLLDRPERQEWLRERYGAYELVPIQPPDWVTPAACSQKADDSHADLPL